MEWKRKDRKEVEEIVEVEEVVKKENDVEQLKKESEEKFVEYHERMMAIENIFELRNWYKKHYQEMKNTLLPEHWNMIVELKDSLKKKFEEENSINDGRIE
jgi:protein subunit release factor A